MNSDCKLKISKLLKPNELLEKIANLSQRKWTWIETDYRHFQLLSRILIKYFPQSVRYNLELTCLWNWMSKYLHHAIVNWKQKSKLENFTAGHQ